MSHALTAAELNAIQLRCAVYAAQTRKPENAQLSILDTLAKEQP